MATADRYALSAVFSYEVQGNSFALMDKTEQGLERIETGVTSLKDTLRNSGATQAFSQLFQSGSQAAMTANGAVQQATSQVARTATQVKNAATTTAQAIAPIKAEFRTLQAEARNIDFGDLQDAHAFDAAKNSLHSYIGELAKLEGQIKGDSLAERELKAQLQSAQMGATAKISKATTGKETLDSADTAFQNASNLGKAQQVQQVGQSVMGFFNAPRAEAQEFGMELAGITKVAQVGSASLDDVSNQISNAILQQSTAIATSRSEVSGVYQSLASAGKDFSNTQTVAAEAEAILKNAAALDISNESASALDITLGKVYADSINTYGGIGQMDRRVGSAINDLTGSLKNVKVGGQMVTETFSEMVGFLGDAQNFKPPDIAAFATVLNSIGVAPGESTGFMGRLDSSIASHTTQFAQALGMTVDELNAQINKDKYATYQKIFASFSKVQGGDLVKAQFLTNLGIGQSTDQSIIKKLASSQQVLKDARQVSNAAFTAASSAENEFNRVSASGAFQNEKMSFALKNLKTQMGVFINAALLPLVKAMATGMESLLAFAQANPKLTSALAVGAFLMGAAAVAAGTLGVAFFSLRMAMSESTLAMNLLQAKAITPLTSYFGTATTAIGEQGFAGAIGKLAGKAGGLGTAFESGGISGVIESLSGSLAGVTAGFEGVAATITGVLSAPLTGTIAMILGIYAAIEILTPGFNVLGAALSIVVAPFGLLFGIVKGLIDGIIGGLKPAFTALITLLAPVGMAIGSVFGGVPQALQQAAGSFLLFANIGEFVGQVIGRTLVLPFTIIGTAINLVIGSIRLIINLVTGAFGAIGALGNLLNPFGKKPAKTDKVEKANTPPPPGLSDYTSGVNSYFGVEAAGAGEAMGGITQKTSFLQTAFNFLLNPLQGMKNLIVSIGDVISNLFLLPLRIIKAVADTIASGFSAIGTAASAAGKVISDTVLAPVRGVQSGVDKVKGFFGVKKEEQQTPAVAAVSLPPPPPPSAGTIVTGAGTVIPAITPEAVAGNAAVAMQPPEQVTPEPYGQVDTAVNFQDLAPKMEAPLSGFAGWFGTQMDMVTTSAQDAGNGIVDALNHNPTVKVPAAWQGAIGRIKGLFTGWVGDSEGKGNLLSTVFSKVADFAFGVFNRATLSAAVFGITSVISLTPAWLLLGAIGAIVLAISTNFLGLKTIVTGVFQIIQGAFQALQGAAEGVITILNGIGQVLHGIPAALTGDLSGIKAGFTAMGDGVQTIFAGIKTGVETALSGVTGIARGVVEGLEQLFNSARLILNLANLETLPATLQGLADRGINAFRSLVDFTRTVVLEVGLGSLVALPERIGGIFDSIRATVSTGSDLIAGVWSALSSRLETIPVLREFANWVSTLPNIFSGAIERIQEKWSALTGAVGGFLNRLTGKAKQTGQELISDLSEASPGPTFTIRQKWMKLTGVIGGKLNELQGHAQTVGAKLTTHLTPKDKLGDHLGKASSGFGALGQILGAVSPQLAAPLFMVNDLASGFETLTTTFPGLTGKLTGLAPKFTQFAGTAKAGLGQIGASVMELVPVVMTQVGVMASSLATLVLPLLPFIAIAAGVAGAVALLALAFRTNFLGIRTVVGGVLGAITGGVRLLGVVFGGVVSVAATLLNPLGWITTGFRVLETVIGFVLLPLNLVYVAATSIGSAIGGIKDTVTGLGSQVETFLTAPFQKAGAAIDKIKAMLPGMKPAGAASPEAVPAAPATMPVVTTPIITPVVTPIVSSLQPTAPVPTTAPAQTALEAAPAITTESAPVAAMSPVLPPVASPDPVQSRWAGFSAWFVGIVRQSGAAVVQLGQSLVNMAQAGVNPITVLTNTVDGIKGRFLGAAATAIAFGLTSATAFAPVLLVLGGIALTIVVLATNFLGVRGAIVGVLQTVKGLATALYGIVNLFTSILTTATEVARGVMQIFGAIPTALKGDFAGLMAGFDQVGAALSAGSERIRASFGIIGDGLRQAFAGVYQAVSSVLDGVLGLFGPFGDTIRGGLSQIPDFFHQSMEQLGGFFDAGLANIRAGWNSLVDFLPAMFEGAIERIKALWSGMTGAVSGFMNRLTGKSKQSGQELIANLAEASPGPTFAIRQKWLALSGVLGQKFDQIAAHAKTTGSHLSENLAGAKLGEGIRGSLNKVGGGFTSLGALISNFNPALATPFFLVNDLADSFTGLSEALPEAKKLVTEFAPKLGGIAENAMKAAAPLQGVLSAGLGKVSGLLPLMRTGLVSTLPVIMSFGGSLLTALLPVLPIIAAVAGGVALFALAFRTNFLGLRTILEGVGAGFGIIFTAVTTLLNPFQLLADLARMVMDAMGAAATWVSGAWEGFSGFFGGIMGGLVQTGVNAGVGLINALNHNPTETIMGAWRHAVFTVIGLHGDMVTSAQHRGGQLGGIFGAIGNSITGALAGTATGVVNTVGNAARGLLFAFIPPLRGVFTTVAGFTGDASSSAKNHAQGLFGAITSMVNGSVNSAFASLRYTVMTLGMSMFLSFGPVILILGAIGIAALLLTGNFLGLKTMISGVFQAIAGIVSGLIQVFQGVFQTIQGIVQAVVSLFRGDFDGFRAGVEQALGGVRVIFDGVGNAIRAVFGGAITFVRGAFEGIMQLATRVGLNIGAALEPAKNLWNGFLSLLQEIEAKLRGVGEAIANSPLGKIVGKAAAVITGKESPTPSAAAVVTAATGTAPEAPAPPAKRSFLDKLLGKPMPETAPTPLATTEQAVTDTTTAPVGVNTVVQGVKTPPPAAGTASPGKTTTEAATEDVSTTASNAANALATVVGAVNPMLGAMIGTVMTMVTGVMTLITTMPALMTEFAAMGGFSGILATSFGAVSAAAGTMWAAITGPALPMLITIGLVVAGVTALYFAFQNNFGGLKDAVMGVWDSIVSTIGGAVSSVVSTLGTLFGSIVSFLIPIVRTGVIIGGVLAAAWALTSVIGFLGGVVATLSTAFALMGGVLSVIGAGFGILTTVMGIVGTLASALIPVFLGGIGAIGAALLPLAGTVIAALLPLLPVIAAIGLAFLILPPIFQFVGGVIGGVFNAFGQIFGSIFDTVGATFQAVFDTIMQVVGEVMAPFQALFATISGGVGQSEGQMTLMSQAIDGLVSAIMLPFQMLGFLVNGIIQAIGFVLQVVIRVGGAILQVFLVPFQIVVGVLAGIIGVVNNVWNAFLGMFVSIGSAVQTVWDAFAQVGVSISAAFAPLFGSGGGGGGGIGGALQAIAGFVTSVLLVPFQILGFVLSSIFNVIGAIAQVIAFLLVPVISLVVAPFQFLATVLGDIFGMMGTLAGIIAAPFQAVWAFIQGIGQAITSIPVLGGLISAVTGGAGGGAEPVAQYATGGPVPGSGNQDSHVAMLTPGEFVMNPLASAMFGPILSAMNNGDAGQATSMLAGPLGQLVANSPLGGLLGQAKDSLMQLMPPLPVPLPVPVPVGAGAGAGALPPVQINLDVGGIQIQGTDGKGNERSPIDMATEILENLTPQLERAVVDLLRNLVEKNR